MKRSLTTYRSVFLFVILTVLGPSATSAKTFTVSVISEAPADDIRKTLPLATYLGKQLQKDGFEQGKVVLAQSATEIASLLGEGKVDLHFDSFARSLALSRLAGSKPFLRRWKKGVAEY